MKRRSKATKCLWATVGLAVAIGGAMIGCSKQSDESVAPPKAGPGEVVKAFDVEGMTCSGCEAKVCEKVEGLEGVKSVKASHKAKKVWVLTAKKDLSDDDVISSIKAADEKYVAKAVKQ